MRKYTKMVEIRGKSTIFLILLLSMKVHGQATTTVAPTTAAPTTATPTPSASSTSAPTTAAPTTAAPTTSVPTTAAATTAALTTAASTTAAPTTAAPSTTAVPTTAAATTDALTTAAPITATPTTAAPSTTAGPTTGTSITAAPTTAAPATYVPTTASATTAAATTAAPTTAAPTTTGSCVFGGNTYDNRAQLPDVCTRFVCVNGKWQHKGNIHSGCSECNLANDPHFITFGGITYDQHGQCEYSLTQMGKGMTSSFAVYGEFAKCISTREKPTCLSVITFKNDENSVIKFETPGYPYKFTEKFNGADINLTLTPKSFGKNNAVFAWRGYCQGGTSHISSSCVCVLGSQGLMIQYCGWSLYIWAHNGLMGSLYGLCGYFSTDSGKDLTDRNGTIYAPPTFYWPRNEVDEDFANSWKASNCTTSAGRKRRSTGTDCKASQTTFEKYRDDCAASIKDSDLKERDRNTTIENCAFDRCTIITANSTNPSPKDWLKQTTQAASRRVAIRNSMTNIKDASQHRVAIRSVVRNIRASNGTSNCTDKDICTTFHVNLCKYQGVVNDCPLLCHSNNTCNLTVCEDEPSCAVTPSALCRYQGVVADCPVLCHTNSTCDVIVSSRDGIKVKVSFRVKNEVFDDKLKDEQSQEFKDLKTRIEKEVKDGLIKELGNRYLNSEVKRFKKGSVVVDMVVTITKELQAFKEAFDLVSNALETGVRNLVLPNITATGCGEGFVDVNNECLKFSNERRTWMAAKEQCQLLSSTLVVPDDFKVMAYYIVNKNLFYWQYWVGASDVSSPGNYKWLDGTAVKSSIWYTGYSPKSGAPGVFPGMSCVKLHPTSNINKGLIASWDTNCNSTNTYRYICEEL